MLNFTTIQSAERLDTPVTNEMQDALQVWRDMYQDAPAWKYKEPPVQTLNLPAFICAEVARQITLEMEINIGTGQEGPETTPRSVFLTEELEKLTRIIRPKLEQACAAGGMIIKPYVTGDRLGFDFAMDWDIYPVAFDDEGNMTDVIIPDYHSDGRNYYTRLERHQLTEAGLEITNHAYHSTDPKALGRRVPLQAVSRWAGLEENVQFPTDRMLLGWFKTANANTRDLNSPLGAAVFDKAVDVIHEADLQFSRILWEYEGSELAVDVDATALKADGSLAERHNRLFRGLNIESGGSDLYQVFSPAIRDDSLLNGLNAILQKVEDLTGLSRGTISDANQDARTATELKIARQRSYVTIADNQKALERCLRDVVAAMAAYADYYNLAPAGEYDVNFEWDDSIITDTETQMQERLQLLNAGILSKAEFRQWYFGETEETAKKALAAVNAEQGQDIDFQFNARSE